jgi:epoxyqueuosine reductase
MGSYPHSRILAVHDRAAHDQETRGSESSAGLSDRIKRFAREAGFELCGVAPVRDFGELEIFPSWIADGRHGEMKYMEARNDAGNLKRAQLRNAAPWARSVIVCAINYNTAQPYSTQVDPSESEGAGWISRYAWCREDYHDAVMRRLRMVESRLLGHACDRADDRPATGGPLQTRAYVDTGPLIERVYAKYAGIGWIGKNTCIINQKLGSWLFLGVILTSLEIAADLAPDPPAPDRCGTCTRCITACPTQAIVAPGELDARLCISYLTIEKRGGIPEELRAGMGRHVFGCDICQDVCPWNRRAPATTANEFQPREGLVNPKLEWLAQMQPEEFRTTFRGSPVRRAKLSGLRRNAVIAMGNSGGEEFVPALQALVQDADSLVAEHAKWALDRKFANGARKDAAGRVSTTESE